MTDSQWQITETKRQVYNTGGSNRSSGGHQPPGRRQQVQRSQSASTDKAKLATVLQETIRYSAPTSTRQQLNHREFSLAFSACGGRAGHPPPDNQRAAMCPFILSVLPSSGSSVRL